MKIRKVLLIIGFWAGSFLQAQFVEYKKLREGAEALASKGLPDDKINVIVSGIPKQLQDSWTILLMQIQQYVDFRTKDEAFNTIDVVTTFQNLITIKEELLRAIRDKNLNPQEHASQMYTTVAQMIKDKLYKIKNVPVLGLGTEYDLWYLFEQIALFLDNFKKRILNDLEKTKQKKG